MRVPGRSALLAAAACLTAHADAQAPHLHVHLAADPDGAGPPAWTRMRKLLPALAGNLDLPAEGPWSIDLDAGGLRVAPGPAAAMTSYLSGELRAGDAVMRLACSFDGLEQWSDSAPRLAGTRLATVLELIGARTGEGPLEIDVAVLVGALSPGCAPGDPLPLLAADCDVLVCEAPDSSGELRGRSGGGLLLPLLLAARADLRAHPATGPRFAARSVSPGDRWVLLAHCGLGGIREEAARQLAVSDDCRAGETLRDLLHAGDTTRAVAMEACLRRHDGEALPELVAAASPRLVLTEPLGEAALWSLLPDLPRRGRDDLLARLTGHDSPRLRAFPARWHYWQRAAADHLGPRDGRREPPAAAALLGLTALALATAVFVRRLG